MIIITRSNVLHGLPIVQLKYLVVSVQKNSGHDPMPIKISGNLSNDFTGHWINPTACM